MVKNKKTRIIIGSHELFKHTSTGATRNKNNGTCLGWLYRSHNWGYICCEDHLTIAIASRTFTWQWNRPRQNHSKCGFSCYILKGTTQIYQEILKLAWQSHWIIDGRFFMNFSAETVNRYEPPERRRWNSRWFSVLQNIQKLHHQKDAILG
jgi:hypothetical protein